MNINKKALAIIVSLYSMVAVAETLALLLTAISSQFVAMIYEIYIYSMLWLSSAAFVIILFVSLRELKKMRRSIVLIILAALIPIGYAMLILFLNIIDIPPHIPFSRVEIDRFFLFVYRLNFYPESGLPSVIGWMPNITMITASIEWIVLLILTRTHGYGDYGKE